MAFSGEKSQFKNLPRKGKPLELTSNPHAVSADDTLYRILSKNMCLSVWVQLTKEITNGISKWKEISTMHGNVNRKMSLNG